ncbi:MAG: WYL domain-containing protein [Planctomycetes bacterium]|nr:WYL domain-containing protein [Planctomycetota bacterium]
MGKQRKKGSWSVEQRLEFIDFRLFWEGRVNRSDLVSFFGVSVPQASADLTQYQLEAKNNAVYDKHLKTYVAGPRFKPVFFEPSAARYLAQLRMIDAGLLSEDEAWAIRSPAHTIVPALRRHMEPETLRAILHAIRYRLSVHISYQAVKRPEPKPRWISPHSLAFDGFRWHARAWCHTRGGFVDFLLARILEIGETKESEIDPEADTAWKREITLRFEPHPDLKGGARKVVELDFGMKNGVVEITTRVCLTYYLERQFGIDSEATPAGGQRHQIVLVNRDELEAARREIGDNCGVDQAKAAKDEY